VRRGRWAASCMCEKLPRWSCGSGRPGTGSALDGGDGGEGCDSDEPVVVSDISSCTARAQGTPWGLFGRVDAKHLSIYN
jgi:hypothetical protein